MNNFKLPITAITINIVVANPITFILKLLSFFFYQILCKWPVTLIDTNSTESVVCNIALTLPLGFYINFITRHCLSWSEMFAHKVHKTRQRYTIQSK